MSAQTKHEEDKLVALASIAAELYSVMSIAWGVSLAAKNAKVISAQAGENGLGFQPITVFIDEISQLAMQGVNDINNEALRLTKIAVSQQRSVDAYLRFNSVRTHHTDKRYIKSMTPAMERVEENMKHMTKEFKKSLNNLTMYLEIMDEHMLSARAVASVSRIVTSNAKEYKDKLKVVADSLEEATVLIKEKISDSYIHLNSVKAQSDF